MSWVGTEQGGSLAGNQSRRGRFKKVQDNNLDDAGEGQVSVPPEYVVDIVPPCILIMDSLNLHSPKTVSGVLKQYLNQEWAERKAAGEGGQRLKSFDDMPVVNCNALVRGLHPCPSSTHISLRLCLSPTI